MSQVYILLGLVVLILGGIGAIWFTARKAGATTEIAAAIKKTADIQNAQLQDSTLPRDPASVADRLRQHQF